MQVGIECAAPITIANLIRRSFIENAYKLDLLVEGRLVLELKSVYPLPAVYFNQMQTQLSLLELKHGMLLNFKVELIKQGIHRVFNNFGKEEIALKQ